MQHAVDVLVAVGAAEGLGQLDALVDHDTQRYIRAMLELVGADPEHGALDWRDFGQRSVQAGGEQGIQGIALLDAAVQQRIEVHAVGLVETREIAREAVDVGGLVAAHEVLVQRLQGELAGPGPCRFVGGLARFGGALFVHVQPICSRMWAISMATRAASRPFSVWRATACSRFSVVRIALAIGVWVSSATRETPAPDSLATSSKW